MGDFVLVRRPKDTNSDVSTHLHVLRVVRIMNTGVAKMEGWDGARNEEQMHNITPSSVPVSDTQT